MTWGTAVACICTSTRCPRRFQFGPSYDMEPPYEGVNLGVRGERVRTLKLLNSRPKKPPDPGELRLNNVLREAQSR